MATYSKEEHLEMLRKMLLARHFEQRLSREVKEGNPNIRGLVHLYVGEEATAVGVCAALEAEDYILTTHRNHGHVIAKGADPKRMMAELYGKATGYSKGKGGSMHIADPSLGIMCANGIVGGVIPMATGVALGSKRLAHNRVTAVFFGDGASNEGTFHESLNLAAIWKLPIIYVCENNLYGGATPTSYHLAVPDVADRAKGYGIPGIIVDGNDVIAVREATAEAAERGRKGLGPTLLESKTYRWHSHMEGRRDAFDPFRKQEEVDAWKLRDPIATYRAKIIAMGILTGEEADGMDRDALGMIDEAVAFAEQSPAPSPEEALTEIFAG